MFRKMQAGVLKFNKSITFNLCSMFCKKAIKPTWSILEFLHSLHSAVVVVEVDGAHHLAAFDIADAQADTADHVTVYQLHYLCCRREFGVDLNVKKGF